MKKEKSKFNNTQVTDKKRALSLLDFFRRRIKSGEFDVESAGWWKDNLDDGATLRIDVTGIGEYEQNDSE